MIQEKVKIKKNVEGKKKIIYFVKKECSTSFSTMFLLEVTTHLLKLTN